ncbi:MULTISPECIES: nitroreductase/quinone reductase family protein [Streptacidiphilus]|uniref:Nitroreductase/quinone reductase family protein n=2 Tax=Streptacidiphilus TaxID=228398 RepID=A0ABV6UFA5_9ACTN|nr:nitroreductase/quinone reductase family protein [Streptacidiphilus jeojiense]
MVDQAQRREWNQKVIEEFRANGGVVGGSFAGSDLLLLTTRGARSGEQRVSPLAAITADGGEGRRWAVFAANGGRPTRPGWYYNLSADPVVTVEVGTETFQAVAEDATGAEREQLWAVMLERLPSLDDFQTTAPGPIPVVVLTRR